MKKLILFAAFVLAVGFSTANAQTVTKKVEKAEQSVTTQKDKAKAGFDKAKCTKDAKCTEACKKECKDGAVKCCKDSKEVKCCKDAKASAKECKKECKDAKASAKEVKKSITKK